MQTPKRGLTEVRFDAMKKKKSENISHPQNGIRPKKLKNSGACGIRHPHLR
jgi:hypothetical protein